MAFLYCIGIVIFYVFGDDKYRNFEKIPIIVSMIYYNSNTLDFVCGLTLARCKTKT